MTQSKSQPEIYRFNNEDQMQAYVVKWFSETYPDYYGCLFKVNNESRNPMFQIATGLIRGASDLILFVNKTMAGIELKMPGKCVGSGKKEREHIATQLAWGETIRKQGGEYIMSDDVEEVKEFIRIILQK